MKNKKLQQLRIAFNTFGDDGVRHVIEGMQKNNTLTELKLDNCDISVKGNYNQITIVNYNMISQTIVSYKPILLFMFSIGGNINKLIF